MASNLSAFLKKNKKYKDNVKYRATKSLCDENGEALEWEIKALTTDEYEKIREAWYKRGSGDRKAGNIQNRNLIHQDFCLN